MSLKRRMMMQSAIQIRHELEVNAANSFLGTVGSVNYRKRFNGLAIYCGWIFDYQSTGLKGNMLIVSKERNAAAIVLGNTPLLPSISFEYEGETYWTNGVTGGADLRDPTKIAAANGVLINNFAQTDNYLLTVDRGASVARDLLNYYYGVI